MASRTKIATNWLGSYELMSGNDLPKNLAVLKHYMYLSTFKYSSNTNGQVIREEIYDTIKDIYTRASIPKFTKSKQRILQQIVDMVSKRKQLNKRKSPDKIKKFQKTLGEIFPVVKSSFDVPRIEREFYLDQCSEKPIMTISKKIDKMQTKRNLKRLKTKNWLDQTNDTDEEDEDDDQDVLPETASDSTSTGDSDNSDVSMFDGPSTSAATGSGKYFTTQLPGLGDSSAAAGISDEKLSRILTEYEAAKGTGFIVTKKKIFTQREKSRRDKIEALQGATVFGEWQQFPSISYIR
jgi:hypothetical protein